VVTLKALPSLRSILSSAYTPFDVREFVELCYLVALPLIRSKIAQGKLQHAATGMRERDIVYDCLADLFERNSEGDFIRVRRFFEREEVVGENATDEELLIALRRLVFLKVQNNIVRLLSEADPALGKVLRNMRLGIQKERTFEAVEQFGETYLVPAGEDPLPERPQFPLDILERELLGIVLVHDTTNVILRKLHAVLMTQNEYRRSIPLIPLALIVKKIFALAWEQQETVEEVKIEAVENDEIRRVAKHVCEQLWNGAAAGYLRKRKHPEEVIRHYLRAIEEILVQEFGSEEQTSYFDILKRWIPRLTKTEYRARHRTTLEYLAKNAKKRMRLAMKSL
jgi:hypothetical protein